MDKSKAKMTAAVAAVMSYIQTEEEAVCMASCMQAAPAALAPPAAPLKLWGISGRQAQMQMRNMMQMKAFHVK
ncbi:hypothetical protein QUF80_03280 [Desulfococcaceae bacterium HSG8]|nr:hypothetical protein [Desulfococcaceae bacterium HSG8]